MTREGTSRSRGIRAGRDVGALDATAGPESDDAAVVLEAGAYYRDQFEGDIDAVVTVLGIRRANSLVTGTVERYLDSLGLGVDLSRARLSVLRAIYFGDDHRLTLNELGRRMKVSRTNITNLIDGLERDGLVLRAINPVDRRLVDAQLTDKGLQVCGVAMPAIARLMESFCAGFSSEEKGQLASLLTRFIDEVARHSLDE
jgi:MarR family 2-MHQ and catechol resistance regulon transcriptional repressor